MTDETWIPLAAKVNDVLAFLQLRMERPGAIDEASRAIAPEPEKDTTAEALASWGTKLDAPAAATGRAVPDSNE